MAEQTLLYTRVARGYRVICGVFGAIAGATIAVMILSTTFDATARYLFNEPMSGVFELNEAVLVICVYMGLAWTQIHRGHIRVTVFQQRFSSRTRVVMDLVAWLLCFVFMLVLSIQSAKGAWQSFLIREFRWGSVQMPIWWIKCLIPLGVWMLCIQLLIDMWAEVERLRGRLPRLEDEQAAH